jgi:hypothetical protein
MGREGARAMLLELVLAVWAFSLPLDLLRARLPFWPGQPARALAAAPRRAPLAEHDWEARVLRNLTSSE